MGRAVYADSDRRSQVSTVSSSNTRQGIGHSAKSLSWSVSMSLLHWSVLPSQRVDSSSGCGWRSAGGSVILFR